MQPVATARSNHSFAPPFGREGEIGDLPCEIVDEDGGRVIYSVWEPSEAERQAIANGQNVRLGVGWIGAFPPVSLGVTHEVAASRCPRLGCRGGCGDPRHELKRPTPRPQPDGGRIHG